MWGTVSIQGETSARVIIRDERGKVILIAWQMLKPCSSPEVADAEALLWGIRLSTDWARQPAMVETDSQT
jgi:hypothetical protein